MHCRLFIGNICKYTYTNTHHDPTKCPLCDEKDSSKHTFLDCSKTRQLWSTINEIAHSCTNSPLQPLNDSTILFGISKPKLTKTEVILDMLLAHTQKALWTEKCKYIHEGKTPSITPSNLGYTRVSNTQSKSSNTP